MELRVSVSAVLWLVYTLCHVHSTVFQERYALQFEAAALFDREVGITLTREE